MLSVEQAAQLAGLKQTTIARAIKAGRLRAIRRENGAYAIDPAELSRVYEIKVGTSSTGEPTGGERHDTTPDLQDRDGCNDPQVATRLAIMTAQIVALRELLRTEQKRSVELRTERDEWKEQAKCLALSLSASATAPARRWWWRRAG